ncbi:MAG: hypothetical protein M1835_002996 [Candelina submexicana]|nr:MAG: hypothetical protein M1835_002996 [Candelina submexicana]
MSGNTFSKSVAPYDASGPSFPELPTQHQPTPTAITPRALSDIVVLDTAHHETIQNPEDNATVVHEQPQDDQSYSARHVAQRSNLTRGSTYTSEIVLHQGTSENGPAPAMRGSRQNEGLAAKRRERQTSALPPIAHDTYPSTATLAFITEDPSQPPVRLHSTRTKRADKPDDALRKLRIKEMGDTCRYCFVKKKVCDAEVQCHRCVTDGKVCLRGIEQLWLWKPISQGLLQRGSRKVALQDARRATFVKSDAALPTLSYWNQLDPAGDNTLMLYLTSAPTKPAMTSCLSAPISSLAAILEAPSKAILQQLDLFLSAQIADPIMTSITGQVDPKLQALLARAKESFRICSFIAAFQDLNYHIASRDLTYPRHASLWLFKFCARALLYKTEGFLAELRSILRSAGEQKQAVRTAIGFYCQVALSLKWSQPIPNISNVVLQDLSSSADGVLSSIISLDRDLFQKGNLLDFVYRHIPTIPKLEHLHLSHELVAPDGGAITSGYARAIDSFEKGYTIENHKMFTSNEDFRSNLRPSTVSQDRDWEHRWDEFDTRDQHNVSIYEYDFAAAGIATAPNPRSERTMSQQSLDRTIVASASITSATVCAPQLDGPIGAYDADQPQLTLEDDSRSRHLMYTNIGMANELKRTHSPVFPGSSRGSPSRKRTQHDFTQEILSPPPTRGPASY